ncbi:DUF3369 domain-containing protein [Alteromonas sp. C1M14]|uniref:DUF3369 domain-containing protein n=1 Tax=Alteromonas sp. C1M14 TaxID=2841567 RepID=UPI001C0A26DE|nr:DUF3369 domain-containing protein [Alteromonas sp. C1M14]MBU2978879.1 DUF3369 domain-containing protein [Alteromonas sp. C1M14]
MSDDFFFIEDDDEAIPEELGSWKVLIVDDEPEVHAVTKLALSDFILDDRRLEFISAYSGDEAKTYLRTHNDVAVVLLDVVMETDNAGLEVAQFIRNVLDNHFTRIILRTGQPGQAPERSVIVDYDINDYKSKTELTAQKLFTVMIASLRSYRDIVVIEENRAGLEKIMDASADLFTSRSLEKFMRGIIQQLASIMGFSKDAAYITNAVAVSRPLRQPSSRELFVFAGNGEYAGKEGKRLNETIPEDAYQLCQQALKEKRIIFGEDYVVAYCYSKHHKDSLLYLSGIPRKLSETNMHLLKLFSENVQLAFENVLVTQEVESTQREIIERLGIAMEGADGGGNHIKRMVEMAELLARYVGLSERDIVTLRLAIPLHDVGNAQVSSHILVKPDTLTDEERFAIRQHSEFGYQILKDSDSPTIQLASILAREHHERWDGKGYPMGLKGEEIQLQSRIATVVDVFDALMNKRPYKEAWSLDKTVATLQGESGRHFDPRLVKYMLENIERFNEIQQRWKDS